MKTRLLILGLLLAGPQAAGWGQEEVGDRVEPPREEHLKQQLTKIERWGLERLLRTERKVDAEQKRRARNSSNPDELALLARDEDSGVRFSVATNRYTPLYVRAQLAADRADFVRGGVAASIALPSGSPLAQRQRLDQIVALLRQDDQVLVRLALSQNPSLPSAVYDSLTVDPDFVVRLTLAQNRLLSPFALRALAADSVEAVRVQALSHRNASPALLLERVELAGPAERLAIAANANTPLPALSVLAADPDPAIRQRVASHAQISPDLIDRLIADPDPQVLVALAKNAKMTRPRLMVLAAHADPQIRQEAERHLAPLIRGEIRDDILERWFSDTP